MLYKAFFARLIGADTVSSNILPINPVNLVILGTHQRVLMKCAPYVIYK